jgi:filamentous hemagglutinin
MNEPQRLMQHQAACDSRRFVRLVRAQQQARRPLWMRVTAAVMTVVMYAAPVVLQFEQTVRAAPPVVDPRAPVTFQPTITQTSTGVPAINIAAPNANGLSVNQYRSFNVDGSGLVLNNSLFSGTPLLGGSLGANPNLNGRAATTILNQVTSTAPSTLAGLLEVFGSPANRIGPAWRGCSRCCPIWGPSPRGKFYRIDGRWRRREHAGATCCDGGQCRRDLRW